MYPKALWKLFNKQTRFVLGAYWFLTLLATPYMYWLVGRFDTDNSFEFHHSLDSLTGNLTLGAVIALACIVMGYARNNRYNEFTLTLPYSRKTIFFSYWSFGTFHIMLATSMSYILTYITIQSTYLHTYMASGYLWKAWSGYLLFTVAIYSLALFVGTFTGGFVSQFIITLFLLILPGVFVVTFDELLRIHTVRDFSLLQYVSPAEPYSLSMLTNTFEMFIEVKNSVIVYEYYLPNWSIHTLLSPLLYIILSLGLGLFLFSRSKSENNGKIIIFERFQPYFFGVATILIMILGGFIIPLFLPFVQPERLYSFYLGAFITGILCFFILRRIMNKKLTWLK
ncbi:acetoin ABC transporter permease [Fictibacillus macauensis ZFHKF-1]|uniref:Acetoin ABC transporter permease n=1 Tax=Fictibacillus macauensis ZFHKF-1 TaxID=1196324 RepID=I8J227_9BACL|nr:hypothetical protein [Fictibacillus macauensis]EIT85801.1 acetoin ABC transporter permease [Fictibacillus macauensis ZFHKF-1]